MRVSDGGMERRARAATSKRRSLYLRGRLTNGVALRDSVLGPTNNKCRPMSRERKLRHATAAASKKEKKRRKEGGGTAASMEQSSSLFGIPPRAKISRI